MNNSSKVLSLILVTGTAGLAAFGLSNTEFAARLPLDSFLAAVAAVGLVRFAIYDYARRPQPLTVPAAIVRPEPRRAHPQFARHSVERLAA